MTAEPKPDVVAGMKALQSDLGDDLAKQVYADASASDRQTTRNHFEARMEYVRQVAQNSLAAENSVKEYGLQTLKWLFLLNAGAIALVLAYIGGKSADGKTAIVAPLALSTWPFMVGCVCVMLAGALSFFLLCRWLAAFARKPSQISRSNWHELAARKNAKCRGRYTIFFQAICPEDRPYKILRDRPCFWVYVLLLLRSVQSFKSGACLDLPSGYGSGLESRRGFILASIVPSLCVGFSACSAGL